MRIKIIENYCFKKIASKNIPLKFTLFFLSFSLFSFLTPVSLIYAQGDSLSPDVIASEASREDALFNKIIFQEKQDQKLAAKRALAEANKQIALERESRLQQEKAQKIIEKKIAEADKRRVALERKEKLQKAKEEKIADKKAAAEFKRQAALNKKAMLEQEREKMIEDRRTAVEVKRQAYLDKRSQYKDRQEKLSLKKGGKALAASEAADYIIIKVRPLKEVLTQAEQLFNSGKYDDALATYNYAYDIAKDKSEKENILKRKNDIKSFAAKWDHERIIAEKKTLQEVEQSMASARKSQLKKERQEKLAQKKSAEEAKKKARLDKKTKL